MTTCMTTCIHCVHFSESELFVYPIQNPTKSGYAAACHATAIRGSDPVFGEPTILGVVECRARNTDGNCQYFQQS